MKKGKLFIWACMIFSIAGIVACNSELESVIQNVEPVSGGPELKEFRATIGKFVSEDTKNSATTRTTVVTDANDDLQLVWADNDTIGIFPSSGNQVGFPMSGSAGSKTARFDGGGWGLKSESTYSAYYPLIGQFYLDQTKIPLIMSAQTQDGNGSYAHIGKSDYMAAVNATVNADGGVDFQFSPLTCLIHMQLKMPTRANFTYVALETSAEFNTEALLDLTTGTVTPTKKSPLQVLKLTNTDLSDGEENPILEVYFSILPVDLSSKLIYVKVFDDAANCYSATLTAKNFEAGTIYNYRKITEEDLTHTGLPVVVLNTPNNVGITSKEDYVENTLISILQTDIMDEFCELTNVKGRGNSTWSAPKKPYAIKFDKKKSLLSLPEDKSWVLLANYYDVTLLRNDLAFYMGHELSSLDWTPNYQQVDLILNGEYKGIYQLGEKVKVGKKRVNVGDDGFLLEVDAHAGEDEITFNVSHIVKPINIKEPEVLVGDDNYNYIKDYLTNVDEILFSDNFLDADEGYKKYIDINSFADWYLINEIAKNNDAVFYSSCYMNLKRGGKLKMGPIWDFDVAFGGYPWEPRGSEVSNIPEDFYIKTNVSWYKRMFQDPEFVEKVKERFNVFYSNRQLIYDRIDMKAAELVEKIYEENKLWGRLLSSASTESEVKTAYQEKVIYLKNWIDTRLEWLNVNINAL